MNKKTIALTSLQYKMIISTMLSGFGSHKPNKKVATALVLEANLGIRISDIIKLKLNDIVFENGRYHLDITEQKTNKKRTFTVPVDIVEYIRAYNKENNIPDNAYIFNTNGRMISERAIQKHLKEVCDFLDYKDISTHSFRKYFATEIYKNNDYNIALVQTLLQHSSTAVTQKYIGISSKEVERALSSHINLI